VIDAFDVRTPGPETAARALLACREALASLPGDRGTGCGCRLIALGSVVAVPREDLAYATGVTARVVAPSLGIDGVMVAEEEPGQPIVLRDFGGRAGQILRAADGTVTVTFDGAGPFQGTALPVGFRRGRIAERIYATNDAGERIVVLIGFSPHELAEYAGAWLVWPS